MSDKTELLIVEVEKHPMFYDKDRRDFKDTEKKKMPGNLVHYDCHSPKYRVLYERWFVRTFERKVARKVAMVAFVVVVVVALCINRP